MWGIFFPTLPPNGKIFATIVKHLGKCPIITRQDAEEGLLDLIASVATKG